ncbi:MAG TPA: HD domain-containing protein, partial [Candidatus Methanoperedens sp.]
MPSIIDPIYGRINISGLEQIIINTPGMARLRRVQQLGLADLAFPGANHTRFEHSIGTLYIADKIARYLELGEEEIMKVRLAGLLHDIGHSAFSHVVESILRRNPQYQPALGGKKFMHHEMFSRHIIGSSFHVIPEIRAQTETFGKPELFFEEIAEIATGDQDGLSKPHLAQIISDDIDADRIDFLLRDSYHTGVSLGLVDLDQIVGSLSLSGGRIVLGGSLSYDEDMALTAAESMLIARAHHYSAIIHNPRTQGARVMLLHALENALL